MKLSVSDVVIKYNICRAEQGKENVQIITISITITIFSYPPPPGSASDVCQRKSSKFAIRLC